MIDKDKTIDKLNAKIEGLKEGSEVQLNEYISESKKMRKKKLANIEEIC